MMKKKISIALAIMLMLSLTLGVLAACNKNVDPTEGKVVVTFVFNGGTLYKPQSVLNSIQHAYVPGSFVIDIATHEGYRFSNGNLLFDGWYTDEELTKPWDFGKEVTEDVTLYAKWKSSYSYVVYLVVDPDDDTKDVSLNTYYVDVGTPFNVSNTSVPGKVRGQSRTFIGYYSDRALTQEWNVDTVHEERAEGYQIPVYVKSIEGLWQLVHDYDELKSAIRSSDNIWLEADIDCGGEELNFSGTSGLFNRTLRGDGYSNPNPNGYTIRNFKIPLRGSTTHPAYSIFNELGASARISNVNFADVSAILENKPDASAVEIAALALSARSGAVVENVTVVGTFVDNLTKEEMNEFVPPTVAELMEMFEKAIATDPQGNAKVTDFTANFTPVSQ